MVRSARKTAQKMERCVVGLPILGMNSLTQVSRYAGNPISILFNHVDVLTQPFPTKHMPAALANNPGSQEVPVWLNLQNQLSYLLNSGT